jgi:hypothetical protein
MRAILYSFYRFTPYLTRVCPSPPASIYAQALSRAQVHKMSTDRLSPDEGLEEVLQINLRTHDFVVLFFCEPHSYSPNRTGVEQSRRPQMN